MDVTFMGAEPRMNGRLSRWRYRYRSVLAVLLLPSLLLIGVFSYYPAVRSLIGGFYQWNGFSPPTYAGISQFRQYLQAPTFGTEAKNIAILTGGSILISLVSQFTAAEVVTYMPRRAGAIAKYVLVLPIVLPPLVLIEVWAYLLQPGSGLIDRILGAVGLPQPTWLSDPHLALIGILLVGFPWISNLGFLIFLGGLQNLPRDVLDAGRLDGLSAVRRVFAIDIPLLMPQFRIVVILSGIFAVQNFVPILLLTNGGPGTATLVPGLDMYQSAFASDQYGYGMAIGTLLFVAMLIFTLVVMRTLRPRTNSLTLARRWGFMFRRTHIRSALGTGVALVAAGVLAAGCSGGSSSSSGSGSGAPVTIKAVLPPNTGPITAADNAGLKQLTQQYEAAHKNVTVQWLPNNMSSITQANAQLESQASGGSAPDVVWEQYGPVTSGALPAGLLQNIKPYLTKPNPYVPGNSSWLSLFTPLTVPYMTSQNGDIDIILGSNVETGFFYSKAAFAKAGITSPPTTWADFMTDLGKLKSAGITPLMYTTGEPCNPSWFERLATSSLLANQVSQFNVNHSQVTNGLDVAVGIHKGIISMSNPRYAEAWKLLGQMVPYSASGQSGYGACQDPNVTTPPLSPQPLLVQGKVGMLWGGSWWIPQLDSAGFTGKFGVFPEPPITTASTPLGLGTSTLGVIGGPNGNGQWSITSQRADSTMTPAKTATVMNFLAWLFTPQHLGYWLKISGSGAYIPTETDAPTVNLPGLSSLVPTGKVPTVVDVVLDDVLSAAATNSGMRLVQEYVNGSLPYSAFASQWQSLLTSSAQAWATQNHVDLGKY